MTPTPGLRSHLAGFSDSLKVRITVGMIVALVFGIGMTTLILVQGTERDLIASARSRELAQVSRTATGLSGKLIELQRALAIRADRLSPKIVASQADVDDYLSSQALLQTMFSSLYIIDQSGQIRALIDDDGLVHPDVNLADRPYFQKAMLEQRSVISDVTVSRRNGEPIIILSQPLLDANGAYGVLAGSLNLLRRDMLIDLVVPDGSHDNSLRVVADGSGRILAHPDRNRVLTQLSAEPRLAEAAKRVNDSGKPIEPIGRTISVSSGVVSASRVYGVDWIVWRSVDEAQLFAPLKPAREQALKWAGILIAVSSILTMLGVSILLRPLKRVQQRAVQMFDDKVDPLIGWPAVGGEIGELASALRQLGAEQARLEGSNDHLLQQLSSVMANAPVGIALTRDSTFEVVSSEFCRLFGRSEGEFLGQQTLMIYDQESEYIALGGAVVAAFSAGEPYVGDIRMRRADGSRFWAHLRGRPVDAADRTAGTIWTVTDVTEEVVTRNELERAAHHDSLTGLANRQAFEIRLERVFGAQPHSMPSSLLMIDLDHFKQVNDSSGHAAGDTVLSAVAKVLLARVRSRDLVARIGGDEFAVLLDHCAPDAAYRLASELSRAISAIEMPSRNVSNAFGASIGIAELNSGFATIDEWAEAADKACYEAKAAGRGGVSVATAPRPALRVVGI